MNGFSDGQLLVIRTQQAALRADAERQRLLAPRPVDGVSTASQLTGPTSAELGEPLAMESAALQAFAMTGDPTVGSAGSNGHRPAARREAVPEYRREAMPERSSAGHAERKAVSDCCGEGVAAA